MFCLKCGEKLFENAKFCLKCGAVIEQPAAALADADTQSAAPVAESVPAPAAVSTSIELTCPKCGSVMPAGSDMCTICGEPLIEPEPVTTRLPEGPVPHFQTVDRAALMRHTLPDADAASEYTAPKTADSKRNIIILVVVLAVVIVGAVFAVMAMGSGASGEVSEQLSIAQRCLDEQEYKQAIIEFDKLLEIDPKNIDAYLGLAEAYKAIGDNDNAVKTLERAKAHIDEADAERINAAIEALNAVVVESVEATTTQMTTVYIDAEEESAEVTSEPAERIYASIEEAMADFDAVYIDAGISGYLEYPFVFNEGRLIVNGKEYNGIQVDEAYTRIDEQNEVVTEYFCLNVDTVVECDVYYYNDPYDGFYTEGVPTVVEGDELFEFRGMSGEIYIGYDERLAAAAGESGERMKCRLTLARFGCSWSHNSGHYELGIVDLEIADGATADTSEAEKYPSSLAEAVAMFEPIDTISQSNHSESWLGNVYDFVWINGRMVRDGDEYMGLVFSGCETVIVDEAYAANMQRFNSDDLALSSYSYETSGELVVTGVINYDPDAMDHDLFLENVDPSVVPFFNIDPDSGRKMSISLYSDGITLTDYDGYECKVTIKNFCSKLGNIYGYDRADVIAIEIIETLE